MTEDTHHKISQDHRRSLKRIVLILALIYVITFLGGFLQDTQWNFFNYIFFFLLFIGGIILMSVTVKSNISRKTKVFLFLTGIVTALLPIFYIGYEWFRLNGYDDIEASVEALLYLTTLVFWIGVIVSLVLIGKLKE